MNSRTITFTEDELDVLTDAMDPGPDHNPDWGYSLGQWIAIKRSIRRKLYKRDPGDPVECECLDLGCPACDGRCSETGQTRLYRIDMDDAGGTWFCRDCADDAMGSGLFTSGGTP